MTHTLTNNAGRRIGVPVRHAFILGIGESREITDNELNEMVANKTTRRWIETGLLNVAGEKISEILDSPSPSRSKSKDKTVHKPKPRSRSIPEPKHGPQAKVVVAADLPDGIEGEGIEYEHCGGGWYNLWVNGFCVTLDGKVRKADAETMAADYE